MNFLVTGATGLVGKAFIQAACQEGHDVSALVRSYNRFLSTEVKQIVVGDFLRFSEIQTTNEFLSAMQGIDVVIHTAARAHVMKEEQADPTVIYKLMNVTLTEQLALEAAQAGVKRFVFISSIKVNGEATHEKPFTESDAAAPLDDYGRSKWAAEKKLIAIGKQTGMEIVILRPPLIYGPGVKGNLASLIKLVQKGVPLPFGAINNRRSMIALDNLVPSIMLAAAHPSAANQTYLVADYEAVSTKQLICFIAEARGKKAQLIPMPVAWMEFAAGLLGKKAVADRLFGSLEVDSNKIRQQLGWHPIVSIHQQLEKIFNESDNGLTHLR